MEDNLFLKDVTINYTYPYLSCYIKTSITDNACEFAFYIYKNSQQLLGEHYQFDQAFF